MTVILHGAHACSGDRNFDPQTHDVFFHWGNITGGDYMSKRQVLPILLGDNLGNEHACSST